MKKTRVIGGSVALDLMLCAGYLPALEPETFQLIEGDVAQKAVYSPYANRAYPPTFSSAIPTSTRASPWTRVP